MHVACNDKHNFLPSTYTIDNTKYNLCNFFFTINFKVRFDIFMLCKSVILLLENQTYFIKNEAHFGFTQKVSCMVQFQFQYDYKPLI
jgi:hypothetical protein